jgi:hypothetical protein
MSSEIERIILAFDVEKQLSKEIKVAATIANSIMRISFFVFTHKIGINDCIQTKLKKVIIKFEKYRKIGTNEQAPLSWTTRGGRTVHVIRLNETFEKRLHNVECDENEKKIILTLMSICIVHEVGHLVMRWKGFRDTPKNFGEAGEYVEKAIFESTVCGIIFKNSSDELWNSNNKFIGE